LKTRNNLEEAVRNFGTIAAILAGVRMAYLLYVLFYRLLIRRPYYALTIEAAGSQSTMLLGHVSAEIHRIQTIIVDAIENPPPRGKSSRSPGMSCSGTRSGVTRSRPATTAG
jgi:hypothetical protein